MSTAKRLGEFRVQVSDSAAARGVSALVAGLGAYIAGGGLFPGDVEWWSPYLVAALLLVPSLAVLHWSHPPGASRRYSLGILSGLAFIGLVGWWMNPRHPSLPFFLFYSAFVCLGLGLVREFRAQVTDSAAVRAGAAVVAALGSLIAGGGLLKGEVVWWSPYLLASLLLLPSLVVLYWSRPLAGAQRYASAIVICLLFMGLLGRLSDPLRPAASFYILFSAFVCVGVVLAWRMLLAAIEG